MKIGIAIVSPASNLSASIPRVLEQGIRRLTKYLKCEENQIKVFASCKAIEQKSPEERADEILSALGR